MSTSHSIFSLLVAALLCSCANTNEPWRTNTSSPQQQKRTTSGVAVTPGKPISELQASSIATECWSRRTGLGCGGVRLEKETKTTWYYRVLEGFGGEPKGLIAVNKRTGHAVPYDDYPLGVR